MTYLRLRVEADRHALGDKLRESHDVQGERPVMLVVSCDSRERPPTGQATASVGLARATTDTNSWLVSGHDLSPRPLPDLF